MGTVVTSPDRRRWLVLAVGLGAMTAGCAFQFGLPFLIPALRADGLSLSQAGGLVACPMAGLMLTLIAWGAAADRWGERTVLGIGLIMAGAALLLCAAAASAGPIALGACLFLAGAGGGSVHAASGRLILGWFGARERGLAMGVRQTAQPLGVAVAAMTMPPLATLGLGAPLVALAGFCLLMAVLVGVFVRDPVRTETDQGEQTRSPYATPVLWRLHTASAMLVVPQFTVATFALVYLMDEHGWDPSTAGRVLAAVQVCGAAARISVGLWSDHVGSRLRPYRILAALIAGIMLVLAVGVYAGSVAAAGVLLVAGVLTVSPNGLAYTAVAEYAGPSWAGRVLGIQNTTQNLLAVATPPLIGAVVSSSGYGAAYATAVAFPLVALLVVPMGAERETVPQRIRAAKTRSGGRRVP